MPRHRDALPQFAPGAIALTDGGLETTLIFLDGVDLPLFAAFPLLDDPDGRRRLREYFRRAADTALEAGLTFSLDTATWRSNPDWAARLGYEGAEFVRINRAAIDLAVSVRDEYPADAPIVVCGVLGPRGDGYRPGERMTAAEARDYHRAQLAIFADSELDYAAALTLSYPEEAEGVALAAADVGIPITVFFTVETDGRLPSGDPLGEAVVHVDAASAGTVASFGVNCAHPGHLPVELFGGADWTRRIRSYRANASRLSHAELDEAEQLDAGDPDELGRQFVELRDALPQLCVIGGCCGTDDRHLRAIARDVTRSISA